MKKISLILLTTSILFMFGVVVSAEILYSGNYGEDIAWTFSDEYVLNISGTGKILDFSSGWDGSSAWKPYRGDTKSIVLEGGIEFIGKFSFCNSPNLLVVTIPHSVSEIGARSFLSCKSLPTITLPKNLSTISDGLFYACKSLSSIRMYNNIKTIEVDAFGQCDSLETVYFYGAEDEWNEISIAEGNEALLNANIVYISEVLPTSISISTKPTYIIGEDTALDIAVTLNHNDGTTTTLSPDEYTLETDFNPNIEGEYNVKVIYGDFTDEVKIKVEPLKMTSIAITTPPKKTEFVEGTELDLSGMVVTGTYNNEKTETITDYTVSGYDSAKTGNQTLTISYNELTVFLPVTVARKSVSGIKITSLPNKLYYCNDETELDLTGFAVETLYNNGTTSECTGYTISGFDSTKTGTQTITVIYRGFSDTFEVEVKRYDYKIDSNISKQYDFDTKTLTVGTHITSRTGAKAVKVIVAVYDENNALMGVKMANTFFDTNEAKDLSIGVENIEYPFDKVKVFVWDFDLGKMLPLAVGV